MNIENINISDIKLRLTTSPFGRKYYVVTGAQINGHNWSMNRNGNGQGVWMQIVNTNEILPDISFYVAREGWSELSDEEIALAAYHEFITLDSNGDISYSDY